MGERGIGFHDLDQIAIQHVDIVRKPCDGSRESRCSIASSSSREALFLGS
jgi:hypothetical protein